MVVPNANRIPPRELPLQKPSAAHAFIPRALVRSTQSSSSHVWMPPNATSGTSQNRRGDKALHNTTPQPVMDLPVQALLAVEGKVTEVESEVFL
ncbi:hypothetical protein, variant [Aphanomyces invadans]|uniref:Uncharacterized protein n=1 Tax=Aphanomyces invadans TaxID=157072 RepID=A0A024T8F4_9STRA|nr:hypothetical protein, variant [Aphanomyces invadans]ETV90249.1 hypothetical protein, variant [Aphanomyces invadans]|eukprot:XP_008881124.1 hypothetical protein, variant [Aphanomyces invadans]